MSIVDNVKTYFTDIIKNYSPYNQEIKTSLLYRSISDFLANYYFDDSYDKIPKEFKQAYESQIIPKEFYDSILISSGYPEDIINSMLIKHKRLLLGHFIDYNRYKGTLQLIERVVNIFNEGINVYELMINRIEDDWYFIPKIIFKSKNQDDFISTDRIPYNEIYQKTNFYFITKNYLEKLYLTDNISLPIKSNLILIERNFFKHIYEINNLFASIVLNNFKDLSITIFFEEDNKTFVITLDVFLKLWFYIIMKYNNIENISTSSYFPHINLFDFNKTDFPFKISDIENILKEYNSINDSFSLYEFQLKYIRIFDDELTQTNITFQDSKNNIKLNIGSDFFDYIEYLLNLEIKNKTYNYLYILETLYNALLTVMLDSDDPSYVNIKYLLEILNLLYVQLKETSSYLLINYLKPFHVEIIQKERNLMVIKDKFNSMFMSESFSISGYITLVSLLSCSDRLKFDPDTIGINDSILKFNTYD